MAIRLIYTLFLGVLVALFVGFGIAAFYPQPQYPEYPVELESRTRPAVEPGVEPTLSPELQEKERQYQEESRRFSRDILPQYNRNVSVAALLAAVIILVISMVSLSKIAILSDGLLLGGVLVLLYAMIRGFMAEDSRYAFVTVSVGLAVALVLGYVRFIKHDEGGKR